MGRVNLSSDGVKLNLRESFKSVSGRREDRGLMRGVRGWRTEWEKRSRSGFACSLLFVAQCYYSQSCTSLPPLPSTPISLSSFFLCLTSLPPDFLFFPLLLPLSYIFFFFLWACLRYKVSLFTMLTVLTAHWGLKVRITHIHTQTFNTPFHLSSPLSHSLFSCRSEEFFYSLCKKVLWWYYGTVIVSDGKTNGLQLECAIYWGPYQNHNFTAFFFLLPFFCH